MDNINKLKNEKEEMTKVLKIAFMQGYKIGFIDGLKESINTTDVNEKVRKVLIGEYVPEKLKNLGAK